LVAWGSGVDAQTGITNLGLLPGAYQSYAQAVSREGNVVTGYCQFPTGQYRAFRWTSTSGMTQLASLDFSLARDISGDGETITGHATGGAFRWTAATGLQPLGLLPNHKTTLGFGISADGLTIVGEAYLASQTHAFRWTQAGGMEDLGSWSPPGQTQLLAVSADGSVAAGWGRGPGGDRALRWTAATGFEELGTLEPFPFSRAHAISDDGRVIVGISSGISVNQRGVRWVDGVAEDLGAIPNTATFIFGVSGDGRVAVGSASFNGTAPKAVMWTEEAGLVILKDFLPTIGVSTLGWQMHSAFDASYDGKVLVGDGIPLSWRAVLPIGSCFANCDLSTQQPILDVGDFACFMKRFTAGEAYANCDRSSVVPTLNIADFACFVRSFAAGCP
jgi:probable HAF family extracellular repeat protein